MHLIAFDGHCPFCHFWVRFLMKIDREKVFRFTSFEDLSSAFPALPINHTTPDSVWYINENKIRSKSSAVLATLKALGRPYRIIALVSGLIPRILRDFIYDFIAKRRYSLFGKYETCPIPAPENLSRFLKKEELQMLKIEMPVRD